MTRPIGGFFALERIGRPVAGNILDLWRARSDNSWMFVNARSALSHLLTERQVNRLLLPAFICPELAAAAGPGIAIAYYPLTPELSPDLAWLTAELEAGDCVVAVDYFGRPPSPDFRNFVSRRAEILWVEDCAQALAPEIWAKWALYSPRKLFGVPDGGILVHADGRIAPPRHAGADVVAATAPRICADADWRFTAYQEVEAGMRVSAQAMSRLTRDLLASLDPAPVMRRRRENYAVLAGLLPGHALIDDPAASFVPMGFPVRVSDRDAVWRRLCGAGVYAARHWAALPSDPVDFAFEHSLSRSIITLPCDQRYDGGDMRRVAAIFEDACR